MAKHEGTERLRHIHEFKKNSKKNNSNCKKRNMGQKMPKDQQALSTPSFIYSMYY